MAVFEARKVQPGVKVPVNRTLEAFQNAGNGKDTATIHLYDAISWWTDNDAKSFKDRLDRIEAKTIHLHINSPGGAVFEGVTIYNLLVSHPAKIIVHIDGLAASIASVIALAGDEVHIAENAMMMIHNPSVVTWGESEDLRKQADVLDAIKEAILNTYESATGMSRDDLSAAMDAETWYSAQEAVDKGFASKKVSAQKAAAFWDGADFPDIPEAAVAFGKKTEAEPPGAAGQKAEGEEDADDAAEEQTRMSVSLQSKGTVEDVLKAREMIAQLKKTHALD